MAFFCPASFSRAPTASPAMVSVWPMWVIAPNSLNLSTPELIVMTGTPAATAFFTLASSPSGLAIETTMPSTLSATAPSISCDCFAGSGSPLYCTLAPYFLPACSAPDLTRSQKASPGAAWVITAYE